MCFTPIYIQQRSRLAVPFPGSRRLGLGRGGLKAERAVICSENTPILGGIEGQGEQPSKGTIYCPGARTLKFILSKLNALSPPAGKSRIFLAWTAGTALSVLQANAAPRSGCEAEDFFDDGLLKMII